MRCVSATMVYVAHRCTAQIHLYTLSQVSEHQCIIYNRSVHSVVRVVHQYRAHHSPAPAAVQSTSHPCSCCSTEYITALLLLAGWLPCAIVHSWALRQAAATPSSLSPSVPLLVVSYPQPNSVGSENMSIGPLNQLRARGLRRGLSPGLAFAVDCQCWVIVEAWSE